MLAFVILFENGFLLHSGEFHIPAVCLIKTAGICRELH